MPSRQLENWILGQHPSLPIETPLSPLSRLGVDCRRGQVTIPGTPTLKWYCAQEAPECILPGPARRFSASGVGFGSLHFYQDPGLNKAVCYRVILLRMYGPEQPRLSFNFTSLREHLNSSLSNMMLLSGEKQHLGKLLVFRNLCTFIFNFAKDAFQLFGLTLKSSKP